MFHMISVSGRRSGRKAASDLLQLVSCALCECAQCRLLLCPCQSVPACFLIGFHWVWLTAICKSGKLGVLTGKHRKQQRLYHLCFCKSHLLSDSVWGKLRHKWAQEVNWPRLLDRKWILCSRQFWTKNLIPWNYIRILLPSGLFVHCILLGLLAGFTLI